MDSKQRERLGRLMMLTTSRNDHEALLALRKANELMERQRCDWQSLLNGGAGPTRRRTSPISEAFKFLTACDLSANVQKFISSLASQWTERGYLTPRQQEALFKTATQRGWQQ